MQESCSCEHMLFKTLATLLTSPLHPAMLKKGPGNMCPGPTRLWINTVHYKLKHSSDLDSVSCMITTFTLGFQRRRRSLWRLRPPLQALTRHPHSLASQLKSCLPAKCRFSHASYKATSGAS